MKVRSSIFVNKLITKVCKMFGKNGSVYPGYIIYDVLKQKDVLNKVKYPKIVIAVTGSSGKGSTTDLINHILTDAGYDVCYNKSGSNGVLAAVTLILNNCDNKGNFRHDVLLLECDERHLKLIFDKKKPSHLIITNMTRDQPSRNGHPDLVFKDIVDSIGDDTTLVLNADDPLVNSLKYEKNNRIITYGLDKNTDSYEKLNNIYPDFAYCPLCSSKLRYKYYNYGHIGNYECPNCKFMRDKVDYEAKNIDYEKHSIDINNNSIYLNKDVLYAAYYTVAAYALCSDIKISDKTIKDAINKDKQESKRGKELILDGRKLTMLESKNENNLSYYQSIKYIVSKKGIKTIILGFDNVSRRYKYNDLSWLWDVDFEKLNDKSIDKIIVIGRFRYDVATRLDLAGIKKDKMILVDDFNNLLNIVKTTKGELYTMVCFDMTANILNLIKEEKHEEV